MWLSIFFPHSLFRINQIHFVFHKRQMIFIMWCWSDLNKKARGTHSKKRPLMQQPGELHEENDVIKIQTSSNILSLPEPFIFSQFCPYPRFENTVLWPELLLS